MCIAIKKYRRTHGLSQKQLAELVGVTQGCITHLESGRRNASPKLAVQFEARTKGKIKRASLRPDIFGKAA